MEILIDLKKKEDRSYKIVIGSLPHIYFKKSVAIVTNPKVAGLHLEKLLKRIKAEEIYIITIGDGEEHKNINTLSFITERMFEHNLNRNSLLIGFGGGVVGDITGFAAAIYQRGIDFILIPTTLLSQVDASVGGKTGINNKFGKNLIGAFYQPKGVFIDTDFLKTLPEREFSAGVSEIIKMAVVFDKNFFKWLKTNSLKDENNLKFAIKRSLELKADVVKKDEKEKGYRMALNYGHTFAHVIENITNYSTFLHGEAVSIGMIMANKLSIELGLLNKSEAEEIKMLLESYSLPTCFEISNIEDFYKRFFLDKKSKDKKIKFVLPKSIGNFEIVEDIEKKSVLKVLKGFEKI